MSRHRPSSPRQPHSPTLPRCTRPPSRTARESHTLSPVRPIAPAILNDAARPSGAGQSRHRPPFRSSAASSAIALSLLGLRVSLSLAGDNRMLLQVWGTAKTRFGANIRRAPPLFPCSEESPRASRQRVPAVMARAAWMRAHGDGPRARVCPRRAPSHTVQSCVSGPFGALEQNGAYSGGAPHTR